jgi:hypothetical protein
LQCSLAVGAVFDIRNHNKYYLLIEKEISEMKIKSYGCRNRGKSRTLVDDSIIDSENLAFSGRAENTKDGVSVTFWTEFEYNMRGSYRIQTEYTEEDIIILFRAVFGNRPLNEVLARLNISAKAETPDAGTLPPGVVPFPARAT